MKLLLTGLNNCSYNYCMRKDPASVAAPRGCTSFKLRQLTRRVSQHY